MFRSLDNFSGAIKFAIFATAISAVIFLPTSALAATDVSNTIITTDTIWTEADSPYYLSENTEVRVSSGATLTLEAGTVVKFGNNSRMNIWGRLVMNGVSDNRVIFTSISDDSVLGDTNGDGLSEGTPGDEWMVILSDFSGPHHINGLVWKNGGGGMMFTKTDALIENSTFTDSNRSVVATGGNYEFRNITLENIRDGLSCGSGECLFSDIVADNIVGSTIVVGNATVFLKNIVITNAGESPALNISVGVEATGENIHLSGGTIGLEVSAGATRGHIDLNNAVIENFTDAGVFLSGGSASISSTTITGNKYGIRTYYWYLGFPPVLSIYDSRIADNTDYGISHQNFTGALSAENNWWGDSSGPYHQIQNPEGLGAVIIGDVNFIPWLAEDPWNPVPPPPPEPECCSSVVFIPGLEASHLYRKQIFENRLWPPNRNDDVRKLYLTSDTGESINDDIYTRDVLSTAYTINIYKSFVEYMNELAEEGNISQFVSLPYDWRMSVKDVATKDISLDDGSYKMVNVIEAMATLSRTGKVTIIAHSNGGLVAKELVRELERQGKKSLIDQLIMVASPQLGTPKAILEMLHGMSPFLLNFPSREVTRELGENMKSAYALLPSENYFSRLPNFLEYPIIEFSTSTSLTQEYRAIYGDSILGYENMRKFLLGENGQRNEPTPSDVDTPNVLKEHFLVEAEALHRLQDFWQPPEGVKVVEIVGWGLDTPYSIRYESSKERVCSFCPIVERLDPRPIITSEGDGTVAYFSAEATGGERYYVDIREYNKAPGNVNRDHKNIFEIEPLQDLLATLLENISTSTLPAFVQTNKPSSDTPLFPIGVHSPVKLHLRDPIGRHTGPIPNLDLDSDLELYEEQIPNSYYWRMGEGQYVGVGADSPVTVKLEGLSLGTFTLEIQEVTGDEITHAIVFEDIPVTEGAQAVIELGNSLEPVLDVDIDGDGNTDVLITPGGVSEEDLLTLIKGVIKTLDLPAKKEKRLIKTIEKLEKELAREHKNQKKEVRKTNRAFELVINRILKLEKKGLLSSEEATELITVIETVRE